MCHLEIELHPFVFNFGVVRIEELFQQFPGDPIHQNSYGLDAHMFPEQRGAVTFQEDGRAIIDFFRSSDLTTAPHEIYHVFRRELERTAKDVRSSAEAKQRWKDICEFVGADENTPWTREQEEKFALAGERYLATGEAPKPELQGIFDRMKNWFLNV